VTVALIGRAGHVDGEIDGIREALEAAIVAAGLGQLEQRRSASSIWSPGDMSTGAS
jgi:hypothetical protein